MLTRRVFMVLAPTAAVAGCVSLPPIRFSPAEIRGWRYVGTRVTAAPDALIQWHGMDTDFAATKGVSQPAVPFDPAGGDGAANINAEYATKVWQLITTEPTRSEFNRFIVSQATGPVSAAIGEQIGGQMTGAREVRVEVTLKSILINHTVLRILVELVQSMRVEVALVDAKTGERLAVYPEVTAILQRRGGVIGVLVDAAIAEPDIVVLSRQIAAQTRNWLFNR